MAALTDEQKKLGWVEGTSAEFLGLTPEEEAQVLEEMEGKPEAEDSE